MKTKMTLLVTILVLTISFSFGQKSSASDTIPLKNNKKEAKYKHSIGASLLMIMNFFPESADYVLITYGYQPNEKNRIFAEFNTWKYPEPIGTYGQSKEDYPGYIRTFGIGFGYQRFHWKGSFTTIQATPFLKQYMDENDNKIQNGFQLYLQIAIGYRFEFFKKHLYVEPAWALKYWPVDTNFPDEFQEIEEGAPNYIFEPSINFGIKF